MNEEFYLAMGAPQASAWVSFFSFLLLVFGYRLREGVCVCVSVSAHWFRLDACARALP